MSTTTSANIMDLLKVQTAEHHRRAEQQPLQQALLSGTVTRQQYARWLGQMMLVHTALERAIEAGTARERRLGVAKREQFGHPRLAADLRSLGEDPAKVTADEGTNAICDQIQIAASAEPVTLLGFHYVLEGSKNGNMYIAKAIRRGLGIAAGAGDTYLDPYGTEQRAKWQAFRASMGEQSYTELETTAIIEAAGSMFDGISSLCAAIT